MWALSLVSALCLLAQGEAYYFESGFSHHYTYWSENALLGQGNVTTILKFQVKPVNRTEDGHNLHSLIVDSLVQYVQNGVILNNPNHWDLSKVFLFAVDENGGVTFVHCHHDDHEELLVIKKAMVSIFSVHIKIEETRDEWNYTAEQTDHLGRLRHAYKAKRTGGGLKLHRNFSSFDDAHRFHEKTLVYDHHGTLHTAEAKDRVHLKDRRPPPEKTTGLPGELPHKVTTSGDFPEIEASATVRVTLDGKSPISGQKATFPNLVRQTLETKQKLVRHGLNSVRRNITNAFDCIQRYPDKDDVNRSLCVNDLRSLLQSLYTQDYRQFVGSILDKGCQDNDTSCEDRHLILIDVVSRIGDVTSQELLVTRVLAKPSPVDEELRRVFIHCVALERPIQRFVWAVAGYCFGPSGERHGSRNLTRTQSRACLAVGSLTRHLAIGGRHMLANTLADRLETWLDEHGKVDHVISKRDTWLTDTEDGVHHVSKAVLLHALGNAALARSRRHLLEHAQPNRGHHVWRRAALDAMRHYTCKESASVMLDCLLKDDKHTVREMAFSVYSKHPKRGDVTRERENVALSRNYTYPAVARVKRDIFEKVLLKFKIAIPEFSWKKELGTSAVGASFGIYFNNYIDAMFKVLSGYVDVNAHDKLWAEIHIGLIGKQWDILRVEACYRGRLSYNMNIVKDFTIGMAEDVSSAFDHIANRIIEPMEKAANDLAGKYQDANTNQPISGFEPLADMVKQLPRRTQSALQSTVNLTRAAESLRGLPLVTKIQQLSSRAQSLMEDVHSETTDLFSTIKDAAVVALPFGEKEIRKSINTVLDKLGEVSQAPKQVFSFIERGKMGYQLAMQRIMEGNNVIRQATSYMSGSRSTFMNAGHELKEILDTTQQLVARLKADHARRKREANPFDEVGQSIASNLDTALDRLYTAADTMTEKVSDTSGIAQDLQEGFDKQALYTEILKTSFEAFKEAIDMIKSRISALFGQKFHPKFPDQRRDCDSKCGCGYYTGECRYGHPGVDLKWDPGWKIPSPVAGVMSPAGTNAVSIKPSTAGFTDYEIIISNVRISIPVSDSGTFVDAGQIIGTPVGKNDCEDSHFHLAMKRKAPDAANGLCYYVDPSPFMDRMQPIPKWTEECKHFTFKHIGDVIDFDSLTEGFALVLEELKRIALDVGKNLLLKAVGSLPDLGVLGPIKGIAGSIIKNIDLDPANLKNLFQGGFDFLGNIASSKFSLGGLMDMAFGGLPDFGNLGPLALSFRNVNGLIGQARNLIKNPSLGGLISFGTGAMTRLIRSRGLAFPSGVPACGAGSAAGSVLESALKSGISGLGQTLGVDGSGFLSGLGSTVTSFASGRADMLASLKSSSCNMCPSFGSALAAATQSACVPHEDCLGLNCDVTLDTIPMTSAKLDFSVRVFPEEGKVRITADGKDTDVIGDGEEEVGGITVAGLANVKFKLKAEWQGRELRFSFSVKACALATICAPDIHVMKNLRFDPRGRRKRSVDDILGPFLGNMESLSIDSVSSMFSDFNFPMDDIVDQVNGIQESISSALTVNEDQAEPTMETEFKNPVDHKDGGIFPLPWQNGEVYLPFFIFKFRYLLGPCLFKFDFDAGGAFGVSFDVKVKAIDSQLRAVFKPWISGKLTATMSLNMGVAKAGIELIGYVMKTGFPLSITTNYNKQPVVTRKALEVELIPLELILKGYLKILWVINIKRNIWHWTADPIRGTIWEKIHRKEDKGPPRFQYCDRVADQCGGRSRRRRQIRGTGAPCSVTQVPGRHPHDAAFKLEFSAEDDDSDLKLWYAIGDYPGGTNVVGWTEMQGASLLVPAILPCGIPLHFLVKARNSQGLETTGRCSISTYDCTFPDGRVDAAYRCSSHPSTLSASLILYEDSKLKPSSQYHGVGYSPSSYGHEVVDWLPLAVSDSQPQPGVSGDLRHFSPPRAGRLTSTPKQSLKTDTAGMCASKCLGMSTCVSFTHNQYLNDCELQEVTEGPRAERKADGHFVTYERLGNALTAALRYEKLLLRHGTRYYVNADIENVLGYRATLTSRGTMVDFTPPEPGYVGNVIKDELTASGCDGSILQRCVDHVTSSLNHRTVVDGVGSTTVLNGNRKGQEMRHSIENYHASANWNGFKDEECGLHGYTFAVGSSVCGSDIASFRDPHASIYNPDDWTHTGLAKDLHLPDGEYFVTVQAVSDIVHGGDLVTTVCHSTPFVIDITPPVMSSVDEILFDETFRYLVVYYNASDHTSGVARMEFGLGRTKYDVMIRRYLPFEIRGQGRNTYLVNEEFETADGVPAWIRLKVVNNVGLSATGSSNAPIILDSTPPFAGHVMDGAELGQDVCCQNGTTEICAQWGDFHDPDSNIESYDWGVGLIPGKDDVVAFHTLSSYDKRSCVQVQLQHNVTYFSTVVANNKALNQKSSNTTSDGLLVDITPPVPGTVSDGADVDKDEDFTSETATVTTTWADFFDPESGLKPFALSVYINQQLDKVFADINQETFTDHSFSLQHGDTVQTELHATNRAGGHVTVPTDGMLVDHTAPILLHICSENQTKYQHRDDILRFTWLFEDHESGITEYRLAIYQLHQGRKVKFWPTVTDFYVLALNSTSSTDGDLQLEGLGLQNGAGYTLAVTAMNGAKLATSEESEMVTVDTTPPDILQVSLSRLDEEEEVNDENEVEHVDGEPLWVTWDPHDAESGVEKSRVCVGWAGTGSCLASFTLEESFVFSASFDVATLQVSTDGDKFLYQVYVVVTNGAGVLSAIKASKPFLILKANVAGVVLDGRKPEDMDFSHDMSAIAITFSGFSSEACGIVDYEWGVGTTPFATDVLPYSDFGLVVDDQGNGFAQAHVMQFEGQTYYSTVRAKTGHNCHEEYIVSSSDGFTVDTVPPSVRFHVDARQVTSDQVVYQTQSDTLEVVWKAEDASGLNETRIILNKFGADSKIVSVPSELTDLITLDPSLSPGDTMFVSITMMDNAGNELTTPLPPVTFDLTPPVLKDLTCTETVSTISSVLVCTWLSMEEEESELTSIEFGLGSGPSVPNLLNVSSVPLHSHQWSFDTQEVVTSHDIKQFFIIINVVNAAGLNTEMQLKVVNDATPPTVIAVDVVTSSQPGYHDIQQKCQTSQDYMEVLLRGLEDEESHIAIVEIALGSSKGRTDIHPFRQYPFLHGRFVMGGLALRQGSVVYVTVKMTNAVGLYTIGVSEGVAISPEPRLEVRDGAGDTDMNGQSELHVMQGVWTYSDPCPVLSVEWSVRELVGKIVTNFTSVPDKKHNLYNDTMALENLKTYVNYVRIRDAMNRTVTAFSDGITVLIRQPDPGAIRDGLALNDVDFQEATDRLSANWDAFGNARSTLPSDQIVRYEAAAGTDRRYASTRSDIHAFENIGLETNVTFYGLNLTAKTSTYYVTVRAYSGAGSYKESSSDGIRVGFSGDVLPGQVQVDKYQSSVSSIRFSWTDFVSDMVITHYYVGVSSTPPPWDNSTRDCVDLKYKTFTFDVYDLKQLETESLAVIEGLKLVHGGTYYVTLIAADTMGHCSAAISDEILVDTTPPVTGKITADGTNADTVLFLHSKHTAVVNLDDFPDPESGIESVHVELMKSDTCDPENHPDGLVSLSTISAVNASRVAMRNLELEEGALYFLRLTVTNRAGLKTTSTSLPMILDTSPPMPGLVRLGNDWRGADRTFQKQIQSIRGMISLKSFSSQEECVTQINLLAADVKSQWQAMQQEFTGDCVGFDTSGMHVIIQHNPYLTGVDKGAAQFRKTAWREGDYAFRMTPATGRNILSGVALTSPLLRPPFLSQNGISTENQTPTCNPTIQICLEDNATTSEGSMLSETEYGTGFSFMKRSSQIMVLFWAQDVIQRKETWIPLEYDPSSTEADYVLRFQKKLSDQKETWGVTFSINGEAKVGVSGLSFPEEVVVNVYTWNINDFIPPITDTFQPFRASIVISAMSLPVDHRPLCSYGSPFFDSQSGIKQVWVGVSDEFNATSNVAPFKLLKSYCLPCLKGCDAMCSSCNGSFVTDDYSVLPVMIDGLLLQAANKVPLANNSASPNSSLIVNSSSELKSASEELQQFQLPTYYLDVRVVDHSGQATDVKSVGLVVDTSPPVVNSFACTDPEYMADVDIQYLGNNHTVGVKWHVSDDVSSIQYVTLSIGTQRGSENIAPSIHVDPSKGEYVFKNLAPLLMEGETYFVMLEAQNQAGLISHAWSNFTVQTTPPDLAAVTLSLPNVTVLTFGGVNVGMMENTERLELNLDLDPTTADDMDVDYFELGIGTAAGSDDVFPRTVVGWKNTKKVAIVDGFIQRADITQKISIGDYAKQNYSSDTLPDPSANRFLMEPGRCLFQQLYGVSKSHVRTAIDVMPLCVRRPFDVLLEADNATHQLSRKNDTFSIDDWSSSAESLRIKVKMSKGALVAGSVHDTDLNSQYGSSASTQFSPFIVRPDPRTDPSSRWLKKRLVSIPGPDIFLSPIAFAELSDDVEVNYIVPVTVDIPHDSLVLMVFWNPKTKQWEAPQDVCTGASQSYEEVTRNLSAKLCPEVFGDFPSQADARRSGPRSRRSISTSTASLGSLGPRMVTVAVVRTSTVNLPPVIHNTSFSMPEDGGVYSFTITYADDEGDEVRFSMSRPPLHGAANVSESGVVMYRPDPNFSGLDILHLTGRELLDARAQALGVVPNTVNLTITVHVTQVNDPPDISFLPAENNSVVSHELLVGPTAGNGVNMSVFVEGNSTRLVALGIVLFSDVDRDDITYLDVLRTNQGADFIISDIAAGDPKLSGINTAGTPGVSGKEILLNISDDYSGNVVYEARVKDTAGAFSLQLTLSVNVLINPCFHGNCAPRVLPGSCQDQLRAFTFNPYFCQCDLGYEGQWCERETDECLTAICSPITDCVDLIGGYRCDPNSTKLAAIVLCPLLALLLGVFVVYKLKKRNPKVGVWPGSSIADLKAEAKMSSEPNRPETSRTVSDINCTTLEPEPEVVKEFDFLNHPLFAFHPSQNPTAAGGLRAIGTDLPPLPAATAGKPPSATKLNAGNKIVLQAKPGQAKRGGQPHASSSRSTCEGNVPTEPLQNEVNVSDREVIFQERNDVMSPGLTSSGNRHSSVTGVVQKDRQLPKVEN